MSSSKFEYPRSITINVHPDNIKFDDDSTFFDLKKPITIDDVLTVLNDEIAKRASESGLDSTCLVAHEDDFQPFTPVGLGVYNLLSKAKFPYNEVPLRVWVVKASTEELRTSDTSSIADKYKFRVPRKYANDESPYMVIQEGKQRIFTNRRAMLDAFPLIEDELTDFRSRAKAGDYCVFGDFTIMRLRNQI